MPIRTPPKRSSSDSDQSKRPVSSSVPRVQAGEKTPRPAPKSTPTADSPLKGSVSIDVDAMEARLGTELSRERKFKAVKIGAVAILLFVVAFVGLSTRTVRLFSSPALEDPELPEVLHAALRERDITQRVLRGACGDVGMFADKATNELRKSSALDREKVAGRLHKHWYAINDAIEQIGRRKLWPGTESFYAECETQTKLIGEVLGGVNEGTDVNATALPEVSTRIRELVQVSLSQAGP